MKKRFLFLIIGLNLLLISSVSMSVAWFLGSLDLYVRDITLELDVDADLRISTEDKFKYAKDSVGSDDLGEIDNFIPVSSMLSYNWVNDPNHRVYPQFIAQYKTSFQKDQIPGIAKKGYFTKVLYLFSDHHMYATFDSAKTTITPNEVLNEQKAFEKARNKAIDEYRDKADEEILEYGITDEATKQVIYERVKNELEAEYKQSILDNLNKIEDSLRISILDYENLTHNNYTIIDPKKTADPVVFGGRLSTSIKKDYFDYYSANSKLYETVFGDILEYDHDIKYKDPLTEDIPATGEHTCFNAGTRRGVHQLDTEDLKTNVVFAEEQSISPQTADVSTHPNNENEGYLIELFPGKAHPITLSVYLEGWDRDNVDATQEAAFNMSIHFKLYKQAH